jgi:hypothetical protein
MRDRTLWIPHRPAHERHGSTHSFCDLHKGLALDAEIRGLLPVLLIERPPHGVANVPSIRNKDLTARAVTIEPLVGGEAADLRLGGQSLERLAAFNVRSMQSFPAEGSADRAGGYAWGMSAVDRQ